MAAQDAADPKLRRSLEALAALAGAAAIRSRDLSRTHRERLLAHGYLREVLKGWYVPAGSAQPSDPARAWYDDFWGFCAGYLEARFGPEWCLAPEHSLAIHTGDWTVPPQLAVRTPRGGNKPLTLPHGTGLLDLRLQPPPAEQVQVRALGVRIMDLETALIASPASSYREQPRLLHAALWLLDDVEALASRLIAGGHSKVAGRLVGALRRIDRHDLAAALATAMQTAGMSVAASDPLPRRPLLTGRDPSPYLNRQSLRRRWAAMRPAVLEAWPAAPEQRAGQAGAPAGAEHFVREHRHWHRLLLEPSVNAGAVRAGSIGEYRRHARFRRGSPHTPPRHEAMRDLLPVLFEMLRAETDARVAAVLGHWLLTLLAPFEHGNRLLALALSRYLLGAADYLSIAAAPAGYQSALETAWVEDDPRPLTRLLGGAGA